MKKIIFCLLLVLLSVIGLKAQTSGIMKDGLSMDSVVGQISGAVSKKAEKSFNELLKKNVPEYSGTLAVELNGGQPYFSAEDKKPFVSKKGKQLRKSFEKYSKLDSLGRCGTAYASICKETIPTEKRGEIGQMKPSGWHTVKYPGVVDGNYLYNRCHLIAYCLAGENANKKNLITGTRYLNVEGMLPYETKVAKYMDKHPNNHVLYRVTPIFKGKNLVASGVIMEAYSIEDKGKGICFNVYVFNVQPGVSIDYKTGDSKLQK